MLLVTPTVLIVIVTVIAIVAIYACYKYKTHDEYQKSKIHIFASVLGATAVVLTVLLYFNLMQLHNRQSDTEAHKEMVDINQTILQILNDELKKASSKIPAFVISITPVGTSRCEIAKEDSGAIRPDPETPETCAWRKSISSRIFDIWQDVTLGGKSVMGNMRTYLVKFLQMAVSDQLQEQWNNLKVEYSDITMEFGDMLFKKAETIEDIKNPMSYYQAAIEMMESPEYQSMKAKARAFSRNS